jgi:phytoene dehydrogenase-like protein
MVRCIEDNKGVVRNNSEVEEIIVRDGVATGVRLSDGTEYIANRAVVCNVGPTLIFGDGKMVDSVHLDEKFLRQVKRFRPGNVALFTPHYALNEAPLWKAADKNPPLNNVWDVCVCEDPGVLKRQMADIKKGIVPKDLGYMVVMCTKKDPTQAPSGKHTAFIWQYAPNTDIVEGGANKYDEIKKEYADEITEHWSRYCPNITKNNILARYDDTPLEIIRRNPSMIGGDFSGGAMDQDQLGTFRPFHGYPPYRTPIENLYMCGPNCHPGGGCSGAAGYNAANVIADDFKIEKWWKPFVYIPPEQRE